MPADAVKLSIQPVFAGWITLLTQIPIQLFFEQIRQLVDAQNG